MTFETVKPILDAITAQISVTNVVAVIAAAAAICVGFAFMWWVARKVTRMVMGAFKKGKVNP